MNDSFQKRKKDILIKEDKSHIGKWDEKIKSLCDKINSLENYYTTSSCSGRIILMVDAEKKGKDLFVFVSHDKIDFKELKNELERLVRSKAAHDFLSSESAFGQDSSQNKKVKIMPNLHEKEVITKASVNEQDNLNIKFKLEPCILHIACKSIKHAEKLLEKGKLAGWKKSGIIGLKNGITIELNSTEKLEFPIIRDKNILVSDEFLKIAVDNSNSKLEKSWKKIERLEGMI